MCGGGGGWGGGARGGGGGEKREKERAGLFLRAEFVFTKTFFFFK